MKLPLFYLKQEIQIPFSDLRKLIKYEEKLSVNTNQNDYFENLFKRTTASYRAKVDKENAEKHLQTIEYGRKKNGRNGGQEKQPLSQFSAERLSSGDKAYLRTITNTSSRSTAYLGESNERVGGKGTLRGAETNDAENVFKTIAQHLKGNTQTKETRGSWESEAQRIVSCTEAIKRLPRQDFNRQKQWHAEQSESRLERRSGAKTTESDSDIRESSYSFESLISSNPHNKRPISKAAKQDLQKAKQVGGFSKQASEKPTSLIGKNETRSADAAPKRISESFLQYGDKYKGNSATSKQVTEISLKKHGSAKTYAESSGTSDWATQKSSEYHRQSVERSTEDECYQPLIHHNLPTLSHNTNNTNRVKNSRAAGVGGGGAIADAAHNPQGAKDQRQATWGSREKPRVSALDKMKAYSQHVAIPEQRRRSSKSPPASSRADGERSKQRSRGRNKSEKLAGAGGIGEDDRGASDNYDAHGARRGRSKQRKAQRTRSRTHTRSRQRKPVSSDPVALYQYYQREWQRFRNLIPGENSHTNLRRAIHAKLLASPH